LSKINVADGMLINLPMIEVWKIKWRNWLETCCVGDGRGLFLGWKRLP